MLETCMVIPFSQSSFRIEHNLELGESFLSLPDIGVEYDEIIKKPLSHHPFSVVAFKEIMSWLSLVGPKTVAN